MRYHRKTRIIIFLALFLHSHYTIHASYQTVANTDTELAIDKAKTDRQSQQQITNKPKQSIKPWKGKAADFSRGRLVVSENKRFLTYADGSPFFYLGDTAWELFHRLDEKETNLYLENRRKKGFNVIQAVILAEIDGLNTPNPYGERPLINNNPETPNEAYFSQIDKTIRKAAKKGIFMGLLPTWGDKIDKQWGVGPVVFNKQNAFIYGQYLGKRYKEFPNIIWIIGGDRSGGGANTVIWQAMAQGIRSVDTNHLMTFHPLGSNTSGSWFHHEDWLDFNSCQTGHAHSSFDIFNKLLVGDYTRKPHKPCINMEPCYEDHPFRGNDCPGLTWFDDSHVRQALYWSLFSGAAGHTYGCHAIWQFLSPKYEAVGEARNSWLDDLDLPGAYQLIHARRLMESYDYNSRVPANEIIRTPQENMHDKAVATKGNGYVFIYLPNGNPVDVSLDIFSKDKKVLIRWYDPRTGVYSQVGEYEAQGSFYAKPNTSGKGNDWILVITVVQ